MKYSPAITLVLALLFSCDIPASANDPVSFIREVAPILVQRCLACHGRKDAENDYRVDTFANLQRAGTNDLPPLTAGDPDDSEIMRLISSDDEDERMPKDGDPLTPAEIGTFRRWIEQGAKFDGPDLKSLLVSILPRPPYPDPPGSYSAPVPITAIAFHPNGRQLVIGGYHELTVWDPRDGSLLQRIQNVARRTYGLAFNSDGSLLAVSGGDPGRSGEVRLLNPVDGSEVKLLDTSVNVIFDVAFRPDGQKLAAGFADRTMHVYDVESGMEELAVEHHFDSIMAVNWSLDGSKIISASWDTTAKVTDAASGALLSTYEVHRKPVYDIAIQSDGKHVFSSGSDGKIHLWVIEKNDSKQVAVMGGFGGEVYDLVLVDGQLYSGCRDKSARQHKVDGREQIRSFADHSDSVYSLAVHTDSRRLATGCHDGQVRVWNLDDGNAVTTFTAAPGYARADAIR